MLLLFGYSSFYWNLVGMSAAEDKKQGRLTPLMFPKWHKRCTGERLIKEAKRALIYKGKGTYFNQNLKKEKAC